MDATPRNLNEDRNEGTHGQVVASPSLSQANVTYADVFDTDDECDSDSDLSSYDEESTNHGDIQRDPVHDGTEVLPAVDIISNGLTAKLKPSTTGAFDDIDEDMDRSSVSSDNDQGSRKGNVVPENKFVMALMNAVQSYSTSLRSPSLPSTMVRARQSSSRRTLPQPLYLHELESEESDGSGSESGLSSDTFDDNELLSNRPAFDADQAARILYRPSDPWAEAANVPIEKPVVIAKLNAGAMCEAYIKRGFLGGCEITYISKTWLLSQKWEGFFAELALYSDPTYLRPLQGGVIPKIIGFYVGDGAISVAMELPSPEFWVEASEDMSNHLKRKCIAAFDAIHERGVLHNDVELRHMLISSRGDVTIIDFQESRALKPVKEAGLKAATEADIRLEKRKIRFKLDYGDSRAQESQKRSRVLRREDRKRDSRISRAKRAAAGQSLSPPGEDEEIEPEDPDDVFNPIVDPQTWMNCWIGEPSSPTCCIVPGQDKVRVYSAVQEFLMEEFDRREKDITSATDRLELNVKSHPSSKHSHSMPVRDPTTMSVLPTRINLKRDRDFAGDTLDDVPSPKKRQLSQADAKVVGVELEGQSDAGSSAVVASATPPLNSCTDAASRAAPSIASPIVAEVHVPFEGYTGSDGFIIPNVYSSEGLGRLRQIWIKQYNMQRCKEDNLPYPLAELENLVPNTIVQTYDTGRNGKYTKRRLTRNRGAMRRAQLDMENPGKRKRDAAVRQNDYFRGRTGLSGAGDKGGNEHDKDVVKDSEAEGPRILSWHELLESRLAGYPRSSLYSTTSHAPRRRRFGPKPTVPSRGILRRQLNPQEKARNIANLEMYMKNHPPESDDEDDRDNNRPRASKRARIDSGLSGTRLESSGSGVGFQRYSTTPNAFAASLDRRGGSISSGSRSPSPVTPHSTGAVAGPSMAGTLPSDAIPRRVGHNRSLGGSSCGGDQFSARASVSSLRLSDVTSESDSSDGIDQKPSSSAQPRRKRRYHHQEDVKISYFDTPYFYCVPLEGLPPPAPLTVEDLADMAEVEELIVVENGTGWPWVNFTFSFPWKLPFSR